MALDLNALLAAKRANSLAKSLEEEMVFDLKKEALNQLLNPSASSDLPAFPIEVLVHLLTICPVDRIYMDLQLADIVRFIGWLGPYTEAPQVESTQYISAWIAFYHVPTLAKATGQQVLPFYNLFLKTAYKKHFLLE